VQSCKMTQNIIRIPKYTVRCLIHPQTVPDRRSRVVVSSSQSRQRILSLTPIPFWVYIISSKFFSLVREYANPYWYCALYRNVRKPAMTPFDSDGTHRSTSADDEACANLGMDHSSVLCVPAGRVRTLVNLIFGNRLTI
jgi:hypothetical protein